MMVTRGWLTLGLVVQNVGLDMLFATGDGFQSAPRVTVMHHTSLFTYLFIYFFILLYLLYCSTSLFTTTEQ